MSAFAATGPFTQRSHPSLQLALERDLERIEGALSSWSSRATLYLQGSFARGEACAWLDGGHPVCLSDLDIFLHLPGPAALLRVGGLAKALGEISGELTVPRVDLNLRLPGSREPGPVGFSLHALHEAQLALLACVPGGTRDWRWERYQLNRVVLVALRAAWNLDASGPERRLLGCRAPLDGAWGLRLEPRLRRMALQALDENPGLGLAALPAEVASEHPARWPIAREWVERLHERFATLSREGSGHLSRSERFKGTARLALATPWRTPRVCVDPHAGLFEARRALALAVCPGGLDPAWIERGLWQLGRLGLARRWPAKPRAAFEAGRLASALPNPLRIVSDS